MVPNAFGSVELMFIVIEFNLGNSVEFNENSFFDQLRKKLNDYCSKNQFIARADGACFKMAACIGNGIGLTLCNESHTRTKYGSSSCQHLDLQGLLFTSYKATHH